jgi:hypothetical protein
MITGRIASSTISSSSVNSARLDRPPPVDSRQIASLSDCSMWLVFSNVMTHDLDARRLAQRRLVRVDELAQHPRRGALSRALFPVDLKHRERTAGAVARDQERDEQRPAVVVDV